ncbi:PLC-like phosphodiesterase [Amanita rubescens]|nr:PLC-like phosphodiesterase [Amanita rubescens]
MRALSLFLHLVLAAPLSVMGAFQPMRRATVCNGHAELCSRSYGNVTFIGSHDSFAYSDDPLFLSADQQVDILTQLRLGVRLLQAQSHMWNGQLTFCHTSCLLYYGGTVLDYLIKVKSFLDENPTEVLTLLFTNPESQPVSTVWAPVFDQAGLTSYIYVPPNVPMKYSDWPTLGEMIDSGKRVVMFLDYGANTTQVDFILPEFQMIWETPYGYINASFPCSISRTSGPLSDEDHMYMINHSLNNDIFGLVISDPEAASIVNGDMSILNNAYGCTPLAGNRNPNFLLLDFVNQGDAFHAADILNNLA